MSQVIGIDLGTTNSCVAVWDDTAPRVLPNRWGARTTPCFVGRRKDELIAGYLAKWQAAKNPRNTVHSFSRFLGRDDGVFHFVPYLNRTSSLGTVSLDLPAAPRCDRELEISLAVGVNPVVDVKAYDRLTGRWLVGKWKSGPKVLSSPGLIDAFRRERIPPTPGSVSSQDRGLLTDDGPLFFLSAHH